jgi:hypothetical protein
MGRNEEKYNLWKANDERGLGSGTRRRFTVSACPVRMLGLWCVGDAVREVASSLAAGGQEHPRRTNGE